MSISKVGDAAKQKLFLVHFKDGYIKAVIAVTTDQIKADLAAADEPGRGVGDIEKIVLELIIDEDPFVNESLNAYSDFIDGKLKAVANDINMLDDGEYTFDGLADNKAVNLGREYLPDIITEGYFAYIDCGMDGIPELALKLYYTDSNEYASPYTDYTVIKYDGDGKLRVVCSENTYYRSESNINEYGYITSGGSTGAASYYAEESFITADGREVLILSDHCEMGLSDLTIPQ